MARTLVATRLSLYMGRIKRPPREKILQESATATTKPCLQLPLVTSKTDLYSIKKLIHRLHN